ncbi:LysR family transcriptional regulator [Agrobacterium pusense]|uniref:LysR family transcriptional regulator n=1 Tax=Agrobacterium pusense TaxID=648995 RepID=UPI003FD0A3A9
MRDRFEGLTVFVETVEAGGFAKAGERLALSRSAVGKSVARLEERLGVKLFHRTTRVLTLTEEGQAYYKRCQRALDELHAGEAYLDSGKNEVVGALRISMPVLFGRYCVAPLLIEIARQYPKLELDLRFSDLIVDVVGEGYDLAIRNGPVAEGSGLRMRKLVSQRKVICAAPDYLARKGTPKDISDLAGHDALVYWRNNQLFPWKVRDRDGKLRDCPLNWRLKFDNLEAIVDASVAGMGIGNVPDWLVSAHLQDGRLVTILDDRAPTQLDTYAVWPETEHLPRRLRLVIDTLVERLPASTNSLAANA